MYKKRSEKEHLARLLKKIGGKEHGRKYYYSPVWFDEDLNRNVRFNRRAGSKEIRRMMNKKCRHKQNDYPTKSTIFRKEFNYWNELG